MRGLAIMVLGLTLTLAAPPHPALALPVGPAVALATAGQDAAAVLETVRGGYRGSYRLHLRRGLRGGWSRRHGTVRREPRTPSWLR